MIQIEFYYGMKCNSFSDIIAHALINPMKTWDFLIHVCRAVWLGLQWDRYTHIRKYVFLVIYYHRSIRERTTRPTTMTFSKNILGAILCCKFISECQNLKITFSTFNNLVKRKSALRSFTVAISIWLNIKYKSIKYETSRLGITPPVAADNQTILLYYYYYYSDST